MRETVGAGAWVSAVVLVLSVTGLLQWLARVVPVPVVKGIQFGAGLSLVISAGSTLLLPLGWVDRPSPLDNRLWALLAFLALIVSQRTPPRFFPYALAMFLLGLVLAFMGILVGYEGHYHDHLGLPWFSLWRPAFVMPAWLSHTSAGLALAQLPLTTLNSVLATAALAADLLPDLPAPSVTALGLSVAAMNLSGCWLGAMPVCHGAGGLAAQYRFGARSGASVVLLGLLKIVLGLLFGETLVDLLAHFPHSILGVMVIAAGLELAKVGESLNRGAPDLWETAAEESEGAGDQDRTGGGVGGMVRAVGVAKHRDLSDKERMERWTVMLMTAAGILAVKNDAVGFAAGMLCHWAYRLADVIERRRAQGRGHTETDPLLPST